MGHWWKYALRLIAVIAAGAPAVMNVAGCFESFENPYIKYFAAGVGVCADVYLLASLPAFAHLRQKRREWAFKVGLAIWLACFLWTGLSSGSWLAHALEAAQAPVEQQRKTQETTEGDRQADLASERALLKEQNAVATNGKTDELRKNAAKLAKETRDRIKALEQPNTSPAPAPKAGPIKSPFAGYEKLVTFLLLAFSQGCWFMALDEEPAEKAHRGDAAGEMRHAAEEERAAPLTQSAAQPAKPRGKSASSETMVSAVDSADEMRESRVVVPLRRAVKPTLSEVEALKQRRMSNRRIAALYGVDESTIRRVLKEPKDAASAAPAAQIAG